jgi:hypothetical protein
MTNYDQVRLNNGVKPMFKEVIILFYDECGENHQPRLGKQVGPYNLTRKVCIFDRHIIVRRFSIQFFLKKHKLIYCLFHNEMNKKIRKLCF